ncbi:hypothetical protein A2422_01430 [Candidatus Woesebacteria bacterium RIFOXYC1_FULL_31_51]|uniref:Cell division protein FtsK/SpoIIIE n=1 Tax=Candidatus Woesebacteria bacterium GW2011_GWC2_31_9 TaxID=1618586 RepID=A0A0F9YHS7_9BACT|nr:MAG: cell division protein FtsK [Candidatus Woesebacteria bacterium GW2011_GWF1_31_35]KKP22655.1 MAG: Cell division protein FtsK/SpoIIIE [Candidatus Woesebacteria bacterium GW2011_GWC1_30_29]KKP26913.1 MAG: Cell division protein FtsK/SpoIIIE [Candidatus Woesebacteria bacterium GW2011_GWD1_31_12]KKP27188.1 MAG: Cell division protein FtsK/SpoIIIE [Candidatus Woesebacteria bacterium GW2011_GWB1_31_29]KKP30968.1 MAG: Cell division protein FtsK/SpoIIIE [Candidatus Woesebacteria bacterium GW2011_G
MYPDIVGEPDDLFEDAIKVVCQYDRASASLLQRRLSIGYARAARIIDQLEQAGVIESADGSSKPRKVLLKSANDFKLISSKKQEEADKQINYVPSIIYKPKSAEFLPLEAKNLKDPLDLPLGFDEKDGFVSTNFSKIGNLIITGNVISKKYKFLESYLIFLLSKFDLTYVNLIIQDNTKILEKYNFIPHLLCPIDSQYSMSTLRWLTREIDRRVGIYNKDEKVKFSKIIYIGNSLNFSGNEEEDAIKRITSIGAYAGVHIILIADTMRDFTKFIKDNISARLLFNKFGENEATFEFKEKTMIKTVEVKDKDFKDYFSSFI